MVHCTLIILCEYKQPVLLEIIPKAALDHVHIPYPNLLGPCVNVSSVLSTCKWVVLHVYSN